jgi:hypothetical protein
LKRKAIEELRIGTKSAAAPAFRGFFSVAQAAVPAMMRELFSLAPPLTPQTMWREAGSSRVNDRQRRLSHYFGE